MPRKLLPIFFLFIVALGFAQELRLKKGRISDSIPVLDTIAENFALYLPTKFTKNQKWPLLVVLAKTDKVQKTISIFRKYAEEQNYILAAPNALSDTVSVTENMLRLGRVLSSVERMFPIHEKRVYTAGFDGGARLANLTPFVFDIAGVISCGASIGNLEAIPKNKYYHFIGLVGKEDYVYSDVLTAEKYLNNLKIDNNIILFEGGKEWPPQKHLERAMHFFNLKAMARKLVALDTSYIHHVYGQCLKSIDSLKKNNQLLLADRELKETQNIFRDLRNTDSLKNVKKELRRSKGYKVQKRSEEGARFKELFLKEDYIFALEEDMDTYNYKNLGWWNYQMDKIGKYISSSNKNQRQMGERLAGYINALAEDYIDAVKAQKEVDDERLIFLSMLKTITEPKNHEFYLDVISLSSKYEDYGTALFYLEEVLKTGYDDKDRLYNLKNTALLRISPDFNSLVSKYLKKARFLIKE